MIKLIAMDLDGTLLNHAGKISKFTHHVLQMAHQANIQLVICSGRPYEAAEEVLHSLQFKEKKGIYIGMNGQMIHIFHQNKVIEKPSLQQHHIQEILNHADNALVSAVIYDKNRYIISAPRKNMWIAYVFSYLQKCSWIFRQNDNFQERILIPFNQIQLKSTGKICFCSLPSTLKKIEKKLSSDLYSCVYVSPIWMECQHKEISKGAALEFICEMYHISTEEVLAFGDGENDLSMLNYAGTGVAMKNAMKSVKQAADDICPSNQQDGVAKYLYHYLKKKAES